MTDDDLHALFDHHVMMCPGGTVDEAGDDRCLHEYTTDELAEMEEAVEEGWWNGCPGCHRDLEPVRTKVNRLDQFCEARVELDETIAFLRERVPSMAADLDEVEAEVERVTARILR